MMKRKKAREIALTGLFDFAITIDPVSRVGFEW